MKESNELFQSDGKILNYIKCESDNFDKSKPIDIVYALHGLGGDASSFKDSSKICPNEASKNTMVIIPSANDKVWREESINLLKGLSKKIANDYNIDKTHIVGHSMGGATALDLFCDKNFSADNFFAVSTSYEYENCDPKKSSNVYLYHYLGDSIVPTEGGKSSIPVVGDVVSQNDLTTNAAKYNGCDLSQKNVSKNSYETNTTYSDCPNNKKVSHFETLPSNWRPHSWQEGQTNNIFDIINSGNNTLSSTLPPASKPSTIPPSSSPNKDITSSAASNRSPNLSLMMSTGYAIFMVGSLLASKFTKKTNSHSQKIIEERKEELSLSRN